MNAEKIVARKNTKTVRQSEFRRQHTIQRMVFNSIGSVRWLGVFGCVPGFGAVTRIENHPEHRHFPLDLLCDSTIRAECAVWQYAVEMRSTKSQQQCPVAYLFLRFFFRFILASDGIYILEMLALCSMSYKFHRKIAN